MLRTPFQRHLWTYIIKSIRRSCPFRWQFITNGSTNHPKWILLLNVTSASTQFRIKCEGRCLCSLFDALVKYHRQSLMNSELMKTRLFNTKLKNSQGSQTTQSVWYKPNQWDGRWALNWLHWRRNSIEPVITCSLVHFCKQIHLFGWKRNEFSRLSRQTRENVDGEWMSKRISKHGERFLWNEISFVTALGLNAN